MDEQEFKMKVIAELSELKAQMKSMLIDKRTRPACVQESVKKEVATNRKLILFLFSGLISVVVKILI